MFCSKCGNEIKNGETVCPECGASTTPSTPMQQSAYSAPAQAVNCTSIGGWMGWIFLCIFLPIIGWILTICVTKDQSVKNAMVAYFAVGVILVVLLIILAVLGIFSAADLFR